MIQQGAQPRSAISWRSVTLGLFGVTLIAAVTPYNDYVLANTFVIGNNLPLGALLGFFILAIFVNGPLSRYRPDLALTSGELAVAFAMVLVGCAIPSSALMRYLPASLVYPFWQGRGNAETLALLQSLRMPRWLYPHFTGSDPADWANDPVVTGFAGRWTGEGPPPYTAWAKPIAAWGVYVGLLYGAFLFLTTILRRQWYENERLPFPLATIELALVEAPEPGKWLNTTMSKRVFWICFAGVFCLHAVNAMHLYQPSYVPTIPMEYDFNLVFVDEPWRYADYDLKHAKLFLTAVGVSYFLPGAVSFSMWFFFVAWQAYKMNRGMVSGDPATPGAADEMLGGMLAYLLIVLWIGRGHWALVLRQALRGVRPGESQGRYLSYPTAFWGLVTCSMGLVIWMVLAGADWIGAAVLSLTVLAGLFLVARIVAETGLLQPGSTIFPNRPWAILASLGWSRPTSVDTMFLAGHLTQLHHDVRETFGVFATHAIRLTDQRVFEGGEPAASRRVGRRLILLFAVTIMVSYLVSFSSMLAVEYAHAVTKTPQAKVVNDYAGGYAVTGIWITPTVDYVNGRYHTAHSPAKHVAAGAAITLFLSAMRLRFTWWLLHPVGFLCMSTWPIGQLWMSIMVGWLIRTLVLRFGGARMYLEGRSAMVGIILGEAVAAGFWLIVGVILSEAGLVYRVVRVMPE